MQIQIKIFLLWIPLTINSLIAQDCKIYEHFIQERQDTTLSKVQNLNLANCQIKTLSPHLGDLELYSLNLENNQLHKFPMTQGKFQDLLELNLSNNPDLDLNTVFEAFCSSTRPVKISNQTQLYGSYDMDLNLYISDIEYLPTSIHKIKKLQSIDLIGCGLRGFPPNMYQLPRLLEVDIRHNPDFDLRTLNTFGKSTKSLVISTFYYPIHVDLMYDEEGNWLDNPPANLLHILIPEFENLPSEIANLPNISTLDMSRNHKLNPKTICTAFANYTQPIYLTIASNSFWFDSATCICLPYMEALPPEVGLMKSVRYLESNYHDLKTLPSEIGNLENLEWLWIEGNQLKTIPVEIKKLTKLTYLKLANNPLKTVPLGVLGLKNLIWLDLAGCQLKTIPSEIEQLQNLEILWLDNNQLQELPSEIQNLTKLSWFRLSNNPLKTFPIEILNINTLDTLVLSDCQLEMIPPEIGNLKNLEVLWLTKNQLKSLPQEICQLTKLKELGLTDNPILRKERKRIQKLLPNCKIEFTEL